jgi:hypothetical protein
VNAALGKGGTMTRGIFAIILMMALPVVAIAKDDAVTLYAGFRDGGTFTEVDTQQSLGLDGSGAASLAVDIGVDTSRQIQFFLSHQRTDLSLKGASAGSPALPMNITYLHFGGTNFFGGEIGRGPYVVGGIGVTFFDPSQGYSSELRPSGNLGIGYQLPLGGTFALRFEARGYATLFNSSGGLFCSGGCVISIQGDLITQGEVMLGLSARF